MYAIVVFQLYIVTVQRPILSIFNVPPIFRLYIVTLPYTMLPFTTRG